MRIVRKLNGHPAQHKIVAPLQTVFVAFDPGRGHKFTNNIPALGRYASFSAPALSNQ